MAPRKVWEGNQQLTRLLAPVEDLQPHPSNPRRGDIGVLQESLRRFGQQRPVLALPDGTLVAGHHVYYAAVAEGWTHVAVVRSDLTGDEVKAYLAADNRTAELGVYDDGLLVDLLTGIQSDLSGTGYTGDDVAFLLSMMRPPDHHEVADAFGLVVDGEPEYVTMTFTVPNASRGVVQEALQAAKVEMGTADDAGLATNANGRALAHLAAHFMAGR